jgi:site-specific DNA-methyltransferase (adenine-specific)
LKANDNFLSVPHLASDRHRVSDRSVSDWLARVLDLRLSVHLAHQWTLPNQIRIDMRPPEGGCCGKIPVRVFYPDETADGAAWIWISSQLAEALPILNALDHALIHLSLGKHIGHGSRFTARLRALMLIGKPSDHVWRGEYENWAAANIPPYPAAPVFPKEPSQPAKRVKVDCPSCGSNPHYVSTGMVRRGEQGLCGRGCTDENGSSVRLEAEDPLRFQALRLPSPPPNRIRPRFVHGDALAELEKLPSASVALVCFSPPYGLARQDEYPSVHPDGYTAWIMPIIQQCWRVLRDDGTIAINLPELVVRGLTHPFTRRLIDAMEREGWLRLGNDHFWYKKNTARGFFGRHPRMSIEPIWVLHKTRNYIWNSVKILGKRRNTRFRNVDRQRHLSGTGSGFSRTRDRMNGKFVEADNVIYCAPATTAGGFHCAQYPEPIPERMIQRFTDPEDLVVDIFVGSGTTCNVAALLGRASLGIDIEEKYLHGIEQSALRGLHDYEVAIGGETRRRPENFRTPQWKDRNQDLQASLAQMRDPSSDSSNALGVEYRRVRQQRLAKYVQTRWEETSRSKSLKRLGFPCGVHHAYREPSQPSDWQGGVVAWLAIGALEFRHRRAHFVEMPIAGFPPFVTEFRSAHMRIILGRVYRHA